MRLLEKQADIDVAELQTMRDDKESYLVHAFTNYIKCLYHGDLHDLRIFRLTSLWFDNSTDEWVNKQMKVQDRQYYAKDETFSTVLFDLEKVSPVTMQNVLLSKIFFHFI